MEQSLDPTVQRRRLRVELRRARVEARLTQRQVAEELGWSPSKLLRIENGQVGISRTDLRALLDHYEITDPETINQFVDMAQQGRKQTWSSYRDVLNPEFTIYLGYEGSASLIRQYEQLFIPGILQTEEYARAVIQAFAQPNSSQRVIERQIEARMMRQTLLERADAPEMFFILDEAVVRRWVGSEPGDAGIMKRQLARLQELSEHPSVNLRVVPFSQGPHFGMLGSFVVLEFPEAEDDDLLFLENGRTSVATRDDLEEVARYKEAFFGLEDLALPTAAVSDFLGRVSKDMMNGRQFKG
jgi:transcriptional regulator with XRE-family HTH domain